MPPPPEEPPEDDGDALLTPPGQEADPGQPGPVDSQYATQVRDSRQRVSTNEPELQAKAGAKPFVHCPHDVLLCVVISKIESKVQASAEALIRERCSSHVVGHDCGRQTDGNLLCRHQCMTAVLMGRSKLLLLTAAPTQASSPRRVGTGVSRRSSIPTTAVQAGFAMPVLSSEHLLPHFAQA